MEFKRDSQDLEAGGGDLQEDSSPQESPCLGKNNKKVSELPFPQLLQLSKSGKRNRVRSPSSDTGPEKHHSHSDGFLVCYLSLTSSSCAKGFYPINYI